MSSITLLVAIVLVAVVLGVIVHERNILLPDDLPKRPDRVATPERGVVARVSPPKNVEPVAATSTSSNVSAAPVKSMVFASTDHVTQASVQGYPLLGNVFVVSGTSTAFENQITWRVRDAKRRVMGEGPITVQSPDVGVPGSFSATGTLKEVPKTATGTLFIFEASAKDGSPTHVVTIPVTFTTSTAL